MAAVNSLLLLLTTIAPPTTDPWDPYTSPPFWNDTGTSDLSGGLEPCIPFLGAEGEKRCPANEHYERCGDVCVKSCIEYRCPLKCCVEGCFCNEGHVRGPEGTCVPEGHCPLPPPYPLFSETNRIDEPSSDFRKACGADEYIGCDSHCQRNCSNYHDVIMCDARCVLDCVCIPPKIRGPDGTCILPQQCPSQKDKELKRDDLLICNYIRMMSPEDPRCAKAAMPCNDPFGCPDDASQDSTTDEKRIKLRNGEMSPCFPGADVRGRVTCPAHEHYEECGAICRDACFEHECALQCCVEGCFCDEGYVRDPSSHICIPKERCQQELFSHSRGSEAEVPKRCRPGELLTCHSRCERTCDNYRDENRQCPDECHVGCVCLPPRVRGPDGACVHPRECPPSREAMLEEHMKMAAMICNFVRIMGNPPAWSESCPMIVHECTDPTECFEENSSPPLLGQFSVCRKNEYLNFQLSCPITCDNYGDEPVECGVADRVVPRCDCKEGLVRDSYGGCVQPENCPNKGEPECTDPNGCPAEEESSPSPLQGQFSVCRKNEYLNFQPSCPVTCDNYGDEPVECGVAERVVPRCDCKEGLVRDSYGGCVQTEHCPNKEGEECADPNGCPAKEENSSPPLLGQFLICRRNEYLNILPSCPVTCDNYRDKAKECRVADMLVPRCDCKEGLVRDSHGGCVPPVNCPNTGDAKKCPEHEEWTCGSACPKTCENHDASNVTCIAICRDGCFCREPRVRGPDGTCVLVEECPPKSDVSEQPCPRIDCGVGCFYDTNITRCPVCVCQRAAGPPCPQILCRKGYFLDARAKPCPKCVECPLVNCLRGCRLDRTQEPCPKCVCEGSQESEETSGPPCPQIRCRKGYFLDERATPCPKCVQCPLVKCLRGCRLDRTQEPCPKCVCEGSQESEEMSGPPCPQILCRKGYFLDARAKPCPECVECPLVNCLRGCRLDTTQEPCPKCVCDDQESEAQSALMASECPKNELWSECGSACPKTCSNGGRGRFCPAVCVRGCFCKSPLVRGPRGDCIQVRDCP